MRISELAATSGVPVTTLRFYEKVGLITAARKPNGYRDFRSEVIERLQLIEAAKSLDLSLAEITALLAVVDGETCTRVRDVLHPTLEQRLEEVDAHLASLHRLRDRLATATRSIAACPDAGEPCRTECILGGRPGVGHDAEAHAAALANVVHPLPRRGRHPTTGAPESC